MEKNLSTSSFKLKNSLAVFLAFLIALEAGAGIYLNSNWDLLYRHSRPYEHDALRFRAQIALSEQGRHPKIFFMGSSQTREDIDAAAIQNRLGKNSEVLNLGVSGGWTITMRLQYALVRRAAPGVLVLMPYWRGFYQPFDPAKIKLYLFTWQDLYYLMRCYGVRGFMAKFKDYFLGYVFAMIMPSYRYRESVISIISEIIKAEKNSKSAQFWYKEASPDDYYEKAIQNPDQITQLSIDAETGIQKKIFEDMLKQTLADGIKVIVLEAPWHPLASKIEKNSEAAQADYRSFMDRLQKQYHFTYIREDEFPSFETSDFSKFSYLSEDGRNKFTRFLISRLENVLSMNGSHGNKTE